MEFFNVLKKYKNLARELDLPRLMDMVIEYDRESASKAELVLGSFYTVEIDSKVNSNELKGINCVQRVNLNVEGLRIFVEVDFYTEWKGELTFSTLELGEGFVFHDGFNHVRLRDWEEHVLELLEEAPLNQTVLTLEFQRSFSELKSKLLSDIDGN